MRLLMLVNPLAGRKRGGATAEKALALFRQHGLEVEMRTSGYAGHLIEIAQKEVKGAWDGIIAVGGDGTLYEVVNGMMQGDAALPIPLGIIPVGTGNSFSRDVPLDSVEHAITVIAAGKSRKVDLGHCAAADRDFYFINILGFGFVADVAQKASLYKRWGDLSYVIGVFIITRHLKSYPLTGEIDGRAYHGDNIFVEICNSRKTGGDMIMAPDAAIDDGRLDVVIMSRASRLRLLAALPKIFKGSHVHMKEIATFQAEKVHFAPAETRILTPDGEILGHTPITVSVLPRHLTVFAPASDSAAVAQT